MKINELKRFIGKSIAVNEIHPVNVLISADAGIGKSQVIKQIADYFSMFFIDLRGAYLERPDILGLPSMSNNNTIYALPAMLQPMFDHENGILFLDELNRSDQSVLNTLMQLCTDRTINDRKIKPNWIVIAAINPVSDDYNATIDLDSALLDRFIQIDLEFDRGQLAEYLQTKYKKANELQKDFIQYIKDHFEYQSISTLKNKSAYISPRKLEVALNFLEDSAILDLDNVLPIYFINMFDNYLKDMKAITSSEWKSNLANSALRCKKYNDSNRMDLTAKSIENLTQVKEIITAETISILLEAAPVDQLYKLFEKLIVAGIISPMDFINKNKQLADRFRDLLK